jgi:hypothetical protein
VEDHELVVNILRDVFNGETLSRCTIVHFDGFQVDTDIISIQNDLPSIFSAADVDLNETVNDGVFALVEDVWQQPERVVTRYEIS